MANILLVDDNAEILQLATRFLQFGGHLVTTASNGREAMRIVEAVQRQETETFDLVITDLIMPEQEGLETIVALRRRYPDIKIIAMSGGSRVDPSDNLRVAHKLGASHILVKPFSGSELLSLVATALSAQDGTKPQASPSS